MESRGRGVFVVVEGFLRDDDWLRLLDGELDLRLAVVMESGAGGDEVAHADVFLEPAEAIDLT